MRRNGIILLAALLLLSTGCKKTDIRAAAGASLEVPAPNTDIVVWGEVLYSSESQICIDFPAQVQSIDVEIGDYVKAGTTLITLSTETYQNNLIDLQAKVNFAKASDNNIDYAALQAQISILENQIAYRKAQLNDGSSPDLQLQQNALSLVQKQAQQAQEDSDKYKTLLDSGAISQSDYSVFSDALDQKSKAVNDAKASLAKTTRALQEAIDSLSISLISAQGQLNQQKASAAAAQANLNSMRSKADKPYISGDNIISDLAFGIVEEINVKKGTIISGQTPQNIITLIDADSIYISAVVPEAFIGEISASSKVYIIPTSNKDIKIQGHIIKIPSLAVEDDGDRVVKVQVKPDESSPYIKPGFTADIYFTTENNIP